MDQKNQLHESKEEDAAIPPHTQVINVFDEESGGALSPPPMSSLPGPEGSRRGGPPPPEMRELETRIRKAAMGQKIKKDDQEGITTKPKDEVLERTTQQTQEEELPSNCNTRTRIIPLVEMETMFKTLTEEEKRRMVTTKDSKIERNAGMMIEDEFRQGIEPLPEIRPPGPEDHVPGAYASAQLPRFYMPPQQQQPRLTDDPPLSPVATDHIVTGATVVVADEEAEASRNSAGTTGNDDEEVIEAKILPPEMAERHRPADTTTLKRTRILGWAAFFLVAATGVLIIVLAALGMIGDSESSIDVVPIPPSSREEPTPPSGGYEEDGDVVLAAHDDEEYYPAFQNTLPPSILKDIQDPSTPHYLANRWMVKDPYFKSYSPERQRQRFYMAVIYYSTNGNHWRFQENWMSYNISECGWYSHSSLSVTSAYYVPQVCHDNNHSMSSLSLANNNLTGSLPLFPTFWLPHLYVFDIGNNHIGSTLPPTISHPHMKAFIVENNNFIGSQRSGDGVIDYPNLQVVSTNGNQFKSGVPNSDHILYSSLQNHVEIFNSTDNLFGGTLATEIGLCTRMRYFGRGNLLSGSIPTQVGSMTALEQLELSHNPLINGTIPSELAALPDLSYLGLTNTSLWGSIPEELCVRIQQGSLKIAVNCSMLNCCDQTG